MNEIDYREKYKALKFKFMDSVDMAFRLGYEQGVKEAQLDQIQQQSMAQVDQNGQSAGTQQEQPQEEHDHEEHSHSAHPDGTELDQHIKKLEEMLGKSELALSDVQDLKKTLEEIKLYQGNLSLIKSLESIKQTKVKKPFIMAPQASANLNPVAKQAVGIQEKIVNDIMEKWEKEESNASKNILDTLQIEGLTKKETT